MRPETPLAVENSVGKPAAHAAPNVGTGKRAWRTPTPHFRPCRAERHGRGAVFLRKVYKFSYFPWEKVTIL